MTTPDRSGAPEDIGLLEIFGGPASTFTRSIKLGLHELGIHFIEVNRAPHSEDIKSRNPYGLLPVLVHRPDGLYTKPDDIVTLYESNAIRRYIDEYLAPIAAHSPKGLRQLTPALLSSGGTVDAATVILRARLDGFVSSFSQTIFPALEGGFIKPAAQMKKNGADIETINVALEPGLTRTHSLLEIVESQAKSHNSAKSAGWILGGESTDVTWADLFLFPILDDLRASPAGQLVSGDSPTFPWLADWLNRMDARPSVKITHEGTVAHQAGRKP
ncbi:hypothetical protein EX895_000832 [Sporisorium graminicola]|uniref:GST N-terminal domain-containing protein n=1 Tax=Sporisorium graminicola TaxID=280036 RepID=A0A4U7L0T2_9BASI|nr:hypothetical protein EX895_000832 [Sporisorium graminicola]TKY90834.1 hypothetical protein EX895_000832 [Sporisorium graminicola]